MKEASKKLKVIVHWIQARSPATLWTTNRKGWEGDRVIQQPATNSKLAKGWDDSYNSQYKLNRLNKTEWRQCPGPSAAHSTKSSTKSSEATSLNPTTRRESNWARCLPSPASAPKLVLSTSTPCCQSWRKSRKSSNSKRRSPKKWTSTWMGSATSNYTSPINWWTTKPPNTSSPKSRNDPPSTSKTER